MHIINQLTWWWSHFFVCCGTSGLWLCQINCHLYASSEAAIEQECAWTLRWGCLVSGNNERHGGFSCQTCIITAETHQGSSQNVFPTVIHFTERDKREERETRQREGKSKKRERTWEGDRHIYCIYAMSFIKHALLAMLFHVHFTVSLLQLVPQAAALNKDALVINCPGYIRVLITGLQCLIDFLTSIKWVILCTLFKSMH